MTVCLYFYAFLCFALSNVYYTFVNCLNHLEIFSNTELMAGKPGKLQVSVSLAVAVSRASLTIKATILSRNLILTSINGAYLAESNNVNIRFYVNSNLNTKFGQIMSDFISSQII